MSGLLSIAEAADSVGLSAHTLRYYERIGLIAPVYRRGGARRYGADDMRWLEFLVRLRATGMPMREMRRYAELMRLGPTPSSVAERQAMLEGHAQRIEAHVRGLGETLVYIRQKISAYQDRGAAPPKSVSHNGANP